MELYKIERELGEGLLAKGYLALDLVNRREVVLKISLLSKAESMGVDRQTWYNFYIREVTVLKALNDDPECCKYVPKLYDHFLDKTLVKTYVGGRQVPKETEQAVIVMELVQGKKLNQLFSDWARDYRFREDFHADFRWMILGHLLETIAYIYSRGFEHRDLTTDNIFWTGSEIKLIDFGASCTFEETCLRTLQGRHDLLQFKSLVERICSPEPWTGFTDYDSKLELFRKYWSDDYADRLALITESDLNIKPTTSRFFAISQTRHIPNTLKDDIYRYLEIYNG